MILPESVLTGIGKLNRENSMDTQTHGTTTMGSTRLHPIVMAASVAVILLSATGIGAILGWIPTGVTKQVEPTLTVAPASVTPAPLASAATPSAPVATPVPARAPAKPPHKPAVQHADARNTAVKADDKSALPPTMPAPPIAGPMASNAPMPMPPPPAAPAAQPRPVCSDCGVIELVRETEKPGDGSGVGAMAGTVVGGVLGNQVGRGNGRDAMTIIGAIGGAIAGHQIEKSTKKTKAYEIVVRFDDGTTRTLSQSAPPSWRAGDHVKVLNGVIVPDA
jgi:outer membrane lipoprotein SlyB